MKNIKSKILFESVNGMFSNHDYSVQNVFNRLISEYDGEYTEQASAPFDSRGGRDGVVFENIKFDNSTITIDTKDMEQMPWMDYEAKEKKREEDKNKNYLKETYQKLNSSNEVETGNQEYISNLFDSKRQHRSFITTRFNSKISTIIS